MGGLYCLYRVGGFGHLLMFGQGGFLDHADTVASELNPTRTESVATAAQ
jgi:hypothetical protein